MKFPHLPLGLAIAALAFHTSCKPKPTASTLAPEPAATATPAAETAAATPEPTLPPAPPQAEGNRPGGGGGNFQQRAEERMQRMKTALDLTDDQAQKIRAIYDEQFSSLRDQTQGQSREDRRAAFEKARAAATAAIEQLLTPEQKPKWEAYQQEMEQRRAQRRNSGN